MTKKYTILCYIINKYEIVHEVIEKDPECEYLLITDDPELKSSTWNVIYDAELEGLSIFDKCYAIRFNLFKYCHTPICIYIDANIQVNRPLKILIDKMEAGQYDMCLMPHPFNCYFLSEYKTWIKYRQYNPENAIKFFNMIAMTKYDLKYRGLFQGCFKIVRNGKLNDDFQRMTMSFLKYLGNDNEIERLDQTVYSYVLNMWFNKIKVLPVSEQIVRSSYMTWFKHGSSTVKNLNAFYDISKPDMRYMFNELVECQYLLD